MRPESYADVSLATVLECPRSERSKVLAQKKGDTLILQVEGWK